MLLHHRFVLTAKNRGAYPAVIDGTAGLRLSFRQALVRALVMSRKVSSYPAGFIGIMLPNAAGTNLAVIGSLLAGRVPVMINYAAGAPDACRTAQEICGFGTILTSRALCERIGCPHLDGFVYLEDLRDEVSWRDVLLATLTSMLPARALLRRVGGGDPDDTAVVLFTSGSENEPKAVQLTHRNLLSNCRAIIEAYGLHRDDVAFANLPYFHVFGQNGGLWLPIVGEMTSVTLADPLDFRRMCGLIRRERITLMGGTPTIHWGLLRAAKAGDLESLRVPLSAADRCPEALRRAYLEKHGLVLYEAYGATETSPAVTANTPRSNRPGSVGRPVDGMEVEIADLDSGAPRSTGEEGRIRVRGDGVMKGYFGDPDGTARVLRDGWYDTGDVGYLDEAGFLWLTGRLRRFVKVGGVKVSLARVEEVLDSVLPEGTECCAVALPHDVWGSEIVAVTTSPVDERAIREAMFPLLPSIAVPTRFMVVSQLPKAPTGKTDFRALEQQAGDVAAGR